MGKRKSRKAALPPKKVQKKLEKTFDCPFCNHKGVVECSIDLEHRIAVAACPVCKEDFATAAHALTEPIDVYSEWIDECEKANRKEEDDDR